MAGQALYRKWRSQTFEEVIGQEHVALTLRNALRDGRMSHAYLFTGPRGTGKTSTARILAKAINCLAEDAAARPCNRCRICIAVNEGRLLDLIEIDAASNRGIDEIRDLREKIGFRPSEARYKVYIVDEVHMLTKEAFNALLKTLEEPPPHAVFVLATTEPDRVPETVRSRCQRFDFRRVPTPQIASHLAYILEQERGRAAPEALQAIARRATGSMRDAISLLDQLLSYGDDVLSVARVESVLGLVDAQAVARLVDAMVAHDAAGGLALINQLIAGGVELGELVDQILAYLRSVLFAQVVRSTDGLDLAEETAVAVARQAGALTPGNLLAAIREYSDARMALRDQVPGVPQLPIEIAFVRTAALATSSLASAPLPAASLPNAEARPGSAIKADALHPGPARAEAPQASLQPRPGTSEAQVSKAVAAKPAHQDDLLQAAQQSWERVVEAAGQHGNALIKALLGSVRQLDASGDTLILRFQHDNTRQKLDESGNRQKAESILQEVLGWPVHIRCALMKDENPQPVEHTSQPARARGESDDEVLLNDARKLGAVVKRLEK